MSWEDWQASRFPSRDEVLDRLRAVLSPEEVVALEMGATRSVYAAGLSRGVLSQEDFSKAEGALGAHWWYEGD